MVPYIGLIPLTILTVTTVEAAAEATPPGNSNGNGYGYGNSNTVFVSENVDVSDFIGALLMVSPVIM